jgi:hypothetical protein
MGATAKLAYWAVGLAGVAAWTSLIMRISNQPLAVELALGGMGLVACAWGHSVLFPAVRPVAEPIAPGRLSRDAALEQAAHRVAIGAPRPTVGRPNRRPQSAAQPQDLPPLLRAPLEEAARMEARRLGEALTAAGLFGPVNVRIEADGTALVSPVQENIGVRLPAEVVVRFAAYVTEPDGLAAEGRAGAGTWPGRHLADAIAAHLNAAMPPKPAAVPPGPAQPDAAPAAGAEDLATLRPRPA